MIKYYRISLFFILAVLLLGCSSGSSVDYSKDIVVIDAGHGGHDSGAIGNGLYEKNLVLSIAKKTAKSFKEKGYRVYLTRANDRFIRLSGRTRIADKIDATLFISIHANAIAQKNKFQQIEGVETYYLQKTRDARSQRIATRENVAVLKGAGSKLSQKVIIDSVLTGPKIIESNKLAIDVQGHIMNSVRNEYSDVKNGGVIPAPFYVLVGASRPSILVEVGYITNTKERKRLFKSSYQDAIAQGIAEGASKYLDNRKREMGF